MEISLLTIIGFDKTKRARFRLGPLYCTGSNKVKKAVEGGRFQVAPASCEEIFLGGIGGNVQSGYFMVKGKDDQFPKASLFFVAISKTKGTKKEIKLLGRFLQRTIFYFKGHDLRNIVLKTTVHAYLLIVCRWYFATCLCCLAKLDLRGSMEVPEIFVHS